MEALYPNRSPEAQKKAFDRAKREMRANNLDIIRDPRSGLYFIDDSKYNLELEPLNEKDLAILSIASGAMLMEGIFPFKETIDFMLARFQTTPQARDLEAEDELMLRSEMSRDQDVQKQAEIAFEIFDALWNKNVLCFSYINHSGVVTSNRKVLPRGINLYYGQWYLWASPEEKPEQLKCFLLANMKSFSKLKKTFNDNHEFDLSSQLLHFQWGSAEDLDLIDIELIIPAEMGHKSDQLTRGLGELTKQKDGSFVWKIGYRSIEALCSYILENNLLIADGYPEEQHALLNYLEKAVIAHG